MKLADHTGEKLRALTGWRRIAVSFAAGAFSALGFAPLEFFPALLLGFAALILLLDGVDRGERRLRHGFVTGWAFAFGQYLIGLHWIGYAFLVDPGAHLWQLPFAVTLLPAGLALGIGLACALALYFWQEGAARLLVFAVLYAADEWLRGHLFTGFPWNLPAYGWGASLAILQSTSLMGAYGLSFLTILLGASLADFFTGVKKPLMPLIMLTLFAALWIFGTARLAAHPLQETDLSLRLVQPNVPQREKEDRTFYARNWQRLLDLSVKPGMPTVIIWPEAATPPLLFDRSAMALDQVTLLTGQGRTLITGTTHFARASGHLAFYNSLYVFGAGGRLEAQYDKFHLVPFGEYVPLASLLGKIGVSKLTVGNDGFAAGDGPHTYALPGLPAFSPLICYEIIFPGAVTDHQAPRPQWLVNVTDDFWFGPWAGPYQHLLIARVRAIEEALPVARAANTGISAMIDPLGRISAKLALGKMGVVDARLPRALPPSLYARYGDGAFWLLLLAASGLAGLLGTRARYVFASGNGTVKFRP